MESLLLEWTGGCTKHGTPLSYLTLTEKLVFLICETSLYVHYFYLIQAAYLLYSSPYYVSVILCFMYYLVWFGRLFGGSGNTQKVFSYK